MQRIRVAMGALALTMALLVATPAAIADNPSPSQREWQSQVLTSQFVTMSDGT
ncbi:MAG: hypothetical protein JNL55_29585, partial [Steroidobacter sp.]|nr:hypothetical protein [Steroidobacter sp.]